MRLIHICMFLLFGLGLSAQIDYIGLEQLKWADTSGYVLLTDEDGIQRYVTVDSFRNDLNAIDSTSLISTADSTVNDLQLFKQGSLYATYSVKVKEVTTRSYQSNDTMYYINEVGDTSVYFPIGAYDYADSLHQLIIVQGYNATNREGIEIVEGPTNTFNVGLDIDGLTTKSDVPPNEVYFPYWTNDPVISRNEKVQFQDIVDRAQYPDSVIDDILSSYPLRTELQDTASDLRTLIGSKLDTGDVRVHVVDSVQEILALSASLGDIVYNNDGGGIYEIEADTVTGFTNDNLFVIPLNGNYAVLQPTKGEVVLDWIGGGERLQDAIDYCVAKDDITTVKVVDDITITQTIELKQGCKLIGSFTGEAGVANNNFEIQGTKIFLDLKDSTKVAFECVGGGNYIRGVEISNFIVVSSTKAKAFVSTGMSMGFKSRHISIHGWDASIGNKDSLLYGYIFASGSIETELYNVSVQCRWVGFKCSGSSNGKLYNVRCLQTDTAAYLDGTGWELTSCWFEDLNKHAIIYNGDGEIKIRDLYIENVPKGGAGNTPTILIKKARNVYIASSNFTAGSADSLHNFIELDTVGAAVFTNNEFLYKGNLNITTTSQTGSVVAIGNTHVLNWLIPQTWEGIADSSKITLIGNHPNNGSSTIDSSWFNNSQFSGSVKVYGGDVEIGNSQAYKQDGENVINIKDNDSDGEYYSIAAGQSSIANTTRTTSFGARSGGVTDGVFFGYGSGLNTTATKPTLIGTLSGNNSSGIEITGVGNQVLRSSTGARATGVGYLSLFGNSGNNTTATGHGSGNGQSGNNSSLYGYNVGVLNTFNDVHLFGAGLSADTLNQVKLGSSNTQWLTVRNIDWQVDGTPTDGDIYRYNGTTSQMELIDMHIEGSGSPSGSVTPDAEGQHYEDTDTGTIYYATGVTNTDWVALN